jgi:PPOX class probable F420-dependent enzyme
MVDVVAPFLDDGGDVLRGEHVAHRPGDREHVVLPRTAPDDERRLRCADSIQAAGVPGATLADVHLDRDEALRRAAAADHGVLATLSRAHGASLVPACFAIEGDRLAIPVDSVKPKGSTALGRVRNLERDPRATLLVEHWDPVDWSRLWWVQLLLVRTNEPDGRVAELERLLRARYPQYRDGPFVEVLTFRIEKVGGWEAASRPRAG